MRWQCKAKTIVNGYSDITAMCNTVLSLRISTPDGDTKNCRDSPRVRCFWCSSRAPTGTSASTRGEYKGVAIGLKHFSRLIRKKKWVKKNRSFLIYRLLFRNKKQSCTRIALFYWEGSWAVWWSGGDPGTFQKCACESNCDFRTFAQNGVWRRYSVFIGGGARGHPFRGLYNFA